MVKSTDRRQKMEGGAVFLIKEETMGKVIAEAVKQALKFFQGLGRAKDLANYLGIVKRAAVLGHRFPLALLEGAIRAEPCPLQPKLRLSKVLGELVRTYEVIRDSGGEYEFSHRRLWNAAYHQLLPAEREELHAAVVKYLRLQPESLERDIMIADHSLKAMRTTEAVQATLGVAERLFELGRYEQACTLLERALQQSQQIAGVGASDRRRLHVLAARARRHVGRLQEAITLEVDNIRAAQAEGDTEQLVRSLIGEAMAYRDLDDLATADRLLARAAHEAASAHLDLLEVEALAGRGAVLQAREDPAARQVIEQCIARCTLTPSTDPGAVPSHARADGARGGALRPRARACSRGT
jgi:tetratricopeptide (TPR) repeat protein